MPSKSAEYKQKCIDDWEWMRDNCSDQGYDIFEAKLQLRRKRSNLKSPEHHSCWACAYVDMLEETGEKSKQAACKSYCPVKSWSEGGDEVIKGCLSERAVYREIRGSVNPQERHFQSVIDVIKKNWIIEE